MEDTLALWVLCVAALMLGSMFAIIVPSKVDAVLGHNPRRGIYSGFNVYRFT